MTKKSKRAEVKVEHHSRVGVQFQVKNCSVRDNPLARDWLDLQVKMTDKLEQLQKNPLFEKMHEGPDCISTEDFLMYENDHEDVAEFIEVMDELQGIELQIQDIEDQMLVELMKEILGELFIYPVHPRFYARIMNSLSEVMRHALDKQELQKALMENGVDPKQAVETANQIQIMENERQRKALFKKLCEDGPT